MNGKLVVFFSAGLFFLLSTLETGDICTLSVFQIGGFELNQSINTSQAISEELKFSGSAIETLRGNTTQGPTNEEAHKTEDQLSRQTKCPVQKKSFEKTAIRKVSMTLKEIFTRKRGPEFSEFSLSSKLSAQQKISQGDRSPIFRKNSKHNSDLIKHPKLFLQKKPCKCNECGEAFSYQSDLIVHSRLHGGEKPLNAMNVGKLLVKAQTLSNVKELIL